MDKRILGLPPAVSVMVIMYSRFHNYAARTLAAINENGRFSLTSNPDEAALKKRDEDLFQVARLSVPPILEMTSLMLMLTCCAGSPMGYTSMSP